MHSGKSYQDRTSINLKFEEIVTKSIAGSLKINKLLTFNSIKRTKCNNN